MEKKQTTNNPELLCGECSYPLVYRRVGVVVETAMGLDLTTPLGIEVDDWDCVEQGVYCPNCERYIDVELGNAEIKEAIEDGRILMGKEGEEQGVNLLLSMGLLRRIAIRA